MNFSVVLFMLGLEGAGLQPRRKTWPMGTALAAEDGLFLTQQTRAEYSKSSQVLAAPGARP